MAGFLALGGQDVTCIARGEHLEAVRRDGLRLESGLLGDRSVRVKACTADEYAGAPDVVFVCVKSYALSSVAGLLRRVSTPHTLVIPVLNGFGTGDRLAALLPSARVLDGCIYIVAYVAAPGVIVQSGRTFRLVCGLRPGDGGADGRLELLAGELRACGIKVDLSDDIQRDTFTKWSFISAMACTGAFYDVPAGDMQREGPARDTFVRLARESAAAGLRMGLALPDDLPGRHLAVLDKMTPDSTASLQKDLARGCESELEGILFDMLALGRGLGTDMPEYERVARKFESLKKQSAK